MTDPATAHVLIAVTAPTAENATEWATTVSDLVQAEYGDTMRLAVRINPPAAVPSVPAAPPALSTAQREMFGYALDLVEQRDFSRSGRLTDGDRVVLAELRRMADEAQQPETQADDGLRDRLRRAFCEASGFAWDPDMQEPDEYGEHADAALAVFRGEDGR